jgi:UDP-N-acetylenolpyruvoylglucosamine reductase
MLVEKKIKKNNWAGNINWIPDSTFYPETLDDLKEIIKLASRNDKKVKALGSGHSFSACATTDGLQVSMQKLNRVIHFDQRNLSIEVESGIILRDLYKFLDKNSVALPSMPNTDSITLGGAIANCTHGTNVHFGSFCSYVIEIKLLTAGGDLLVLSKNSADEITSKYFEASLACFGTLGIFYSITLKLSPTYDVLCKRSTARIGEIKGRISQIAKQYDSAQFMFFPFLDLVLLKTQEKTKENYVLHGKSTYLDNVVVDVIFYFFKPRKVKMFTDLFQYIYKTGFFLYFSRNFYKSTSTGKWWSGEVSKNKNRFF